MTWQEYQKMTYEVEKEYYYYSHSHIHDEKYEQLYKKYLEQKEQIAKFEKKVLEKALTNLSKEDIITV